MSKLKDEIEQAMKEDSTVRELQQQVKALESIVENQKKAIEEERTSRFDIPRQKKCKPRKTFIRLIVPDTHGSMVDKDAAAAMLNDAQELKPSQVVMLGDHIDCGGFLAQHHVWGYVAETEYTFKDDVEAGNIFLDQLQKACPKAEFHYLEGNHEVRLERWAVTQALRNGSDAQWLLDIMGPRNVLHLEKRGIHYYEQGGLHMGLKVRGTIKLGHCYFQHGCSHAKHAADKIVQKIGGCVVFGHIHRMQQYTTSTVGTGTISAWSPGCLSTLNPLWKHTDPTGWTHGYGVQIVDRDTGSFLHINVPIVDGTSYMLDLAKLVK